MENKIVYVDNNATTMVAPEVFETMKPFFCERYGNASSIHTFGGSVAAEIEAARRKVAEFLNAKFRNDENQATEIIFTSCGTESDNSAIWSALLSNPQRRKIVTSKVEHPAILSLCKELVRRGYEVDYVGVDGSGKLDMAGLKEAVDQNTAIVSLMWANNETGTIFPIKEAAEIAHAKGALFHTDAVQAAGKIKIDLEDVRVDFLSISGHKLHAPKGVGILYVRRGIRFRPFLIGGHQEKGRRGGTENVTSIIGLGKACDLAMNVEAEAKYVAMLRDRLEAGIRAKVPKIRINGDLTSRLPNTSSISFEYIEGEAILMLLDQYNICASSGSACTTGSLEPSHVLRSMGLPYTAAHGTIRFSFSRYNTIEEVDFIVEKLPPVVARLRQMSPYWQE